MLFPCQQLAAIRTRERLSVRIMAARLGMSRAEYEALEHPKHQLTVSELQKCCEALGIPITEFFEIEERVPHRANILRAYKSALTLKQQSKSLQDSVILDRLIADLLKVMPELDGSTLSYGKSVSAWPLALLRRTSEEYGRVAESPIDMSPFHTESFSHAI